MRKNGTKVSFKLLGAKSRGISHPFRSKHFHLIPQDDGSLEIRVTGKSARRVLEVYNTLGAEEAFSVIAKPLTRAVTQGSKFNRQTQRLAGNAAADNAISKLHDLRDRLLELRDALVKATDGQ